MKKKLFTLITVFLVLSGCAHVISRVNLEKADRSISIADLMQKPDKYKGKIVILGGDIIKTVNKSDGTWIEILQKKLDRRGSPSQGDETLGRFFVTHKGYLDPAIYAKGRLITVAGEVMGSKKLPLGEIEYNYPLIRGIEMHFTDRSTGPAVRFGIGIGGTF